MHGREDRKPTNTGRLASECLVNSEVFVRGSAQGETACLDTQSIATPVLLFPGPQAIPLTQLVGADQPLTLIVPDGTWRQAAKLFRKLSGTRPIPCIALPLGPPSTYRLRRETREAGLATFEAIARALGILEGPEIEAAMDVVFRTVVERTLWARGTIKRSAVTGGIPEEA